MVLIKAPINQEPKLLAHFSSTQTLEIVFKRADASEESLSRRHPNVFTLLKLETFLVARRGIPNSAYKVSRDAVPSVF